MLDLFAAALRIAILVFRKILTALLTVERRLDRGFSAGRHAALVRRSTRRHDMAADPDERYFADQYWRLIEDALSRAGCDAAGLHLDLGCGQGRLALRLARWSAAGGGRVVGVDLSDLAVDQARQYAAGAGINNASFFVSDVASYLAGLESESSSTILLAEILYFTPDAEDILVNAVRVLKTGGFLIASFRSQYFYALVLAQQGLYAKLDDLMECRSGRLLGGDVWFNWNSAAEVRDLLTSRLGLELLDLAGIGACSGIAGDPHAAVLRPAKLTEAERAQVMRAEMRLGRSVPDAGRYILAIGRKP